MSPAIIAAEAANDAHDEAVAEALGCAERLRDTYFRCGEAQVALDVSMGMAMGAYITACRVAGHPRNWPQVHEWIKGADVPGRERAA